MTEPTKRDKYDEVASLIYFDDDGQGRTSRERIAAILRRAYPAASAQSAEPQEDDVRRALDWARSRNDGDDSPARVLADAVDALRARPSREEGMREALDLGLKSWDWSMPPSPTHICGPDAGCDGACAEWASWVDGRAKIISARAALAQGGARDEAQGEGK